MTLVQDATIISPLLLDGWDVGVIVARDGIAARYRMVILAGGLLIAAGIVACGGGDDEASEAHVATTTESDESAATTSTTANSTTTTAPPKPAPIVFTGSDAMTTAPQSIPAGQFVTTFDFSQCESGFGTVKPSDAPEDASRWIAMGGTYIAGERFDEASNSWRVDAGDYFAEVTTLGSCDWSVTLTAL